jgi:hypothetical protein
VNRGAEQAIREAAKKCEILARSSKAGFRNPDGYNAKLRQELLLDFLTITIYRVWRTVGRVGSFVINIETLRKPSGLTGHAKREISSLNNEILNYVNGKTESDRRRN